MTSDVTQGSVLKLTWRSGLLAFFVLFFGNAGIDSLAELHKLGRPIVELLFRSFAISVITAGLLYALGGKRQG